MDWKLIFNVVIVALYPRPRVLWCCLEGNKGRWKTGKGDWEILFYWRKNENYFWYVDEEFM